MADFLYGAADTMHIWRYPVALALCILVWQIAEFIGAAWFDDE